MSFPRYPQYKDSGVDWLGQVPAHWEVKPFYGVAAEQYESNEGMKEDNLLSLSYGRIIPKDINSNDGLLPDSFETYQIVRPGDIVFRLTDLQNDKRSLRTALVTETGIITSAYVAVRPKAANSGFLSYLLRAYDVTKVFYSMGGGLRQGMNFADLKRIPTLVPPAAEQREIAGFLDRETGKIDALVAEQERLLELLKEKRQAVISHAVTRGLNPNAPLKPSGLAWLGDVPTHWEVCMLKRVFRSVDYGISDSLDAEGPIAILRMGNIENGQVVMDDLKYTKEVDKGLLLQCGDLLYNRTNSLDLIGKVGMFRGSEDGPVSFASYLVRIRTVNDSLPEFFAYLLNTEGVLGLARANAFVAIGQCNLNPTRYGQIEIALPPLAEQRAIVAHLDAATAQFDALTAEVERALALLQERRTALISAAVTGQIDVRAAT
jgi:type I restriction enzyme S subunit